MTKNMPDISTYKKISEWLDAYHATDNVSKKAKLKTNIVAQMIPVVKNIARTIARRSTDPIEDMIQAGFIGLLKAIDNYSKEKNDNFKVYAGYIIIGEMKHYLRDKLTMIRVPAHIQELAVRIHNFTKTLTENELEQLTLNDVANLMHTTAKTVDFAMQMERRRNTVSLEEIFHWDNIDSLSYEELLTNKDYIESSNAKDVKIIFNDLIEKLPAEERMLIQMYYKQDMNQKEIAESLQMSRMAVSRRMKNAFNLIAELIEKNHQSKLGGE